VSNRRRPRATTPSPSTEWLRCPDCNSTVHEVFYGEAPQLVLSIEVEHSDSCPVWGEDSREVAIAFLPKAGTE